MLKRLAGIAAAGFAGAFLFVGPLHALPPGTEGYNQSGDTPASGCGTGRALVIHAPADLWPPNHKYYTDIYAKATDSSDGTIKLLTDGTHNQYDQDTEFNGSGHTADDIREADTKKDDGTLAVADDQNTTPTKPASMETNDSVVRTDWEARSERSGQDQAGRTYTFHAKAIWDDQSSCEISVPIHVPHDMRPSNR